MDGEDNSHMCMKIMNMEEPEEFTGFSYTHCAGLQLCKLKKKDNNVPSAFPNTCSAHIMTVNCSRKTS